MRSRPYSSRGGSGPRAKKSVKPFPSRQMLVLALCRICEPIAFMSIFPYISWMIKDFHITEDESMVAFYAGMVTSAFTFAEFSTGMLWGRLSDKIGRKPVLLTGLAGTALSVLIFGFAPNVWVALFARALGGLLNGNIGVLQTTVAELVTVKEHQPRAYTIMPLVWCLGSIVGPMIGGSMARPCVNFPTIFLQDTIWARYPYLLPNLFSAATCVCGVIIGLLFLEETHEEKKHRHDPGLALGQAILRRFTWTTKKDEKADDSETVSLLSQDEQPPTYRTNENSPQLLSTPAPELEAQPLLDFNEVDSTFSRRNSSATIKTDEERNRLNRKAFTKPVIFNIISYGILAFHTMTFDQLFPIFLSTDHPAEKLPVQLPFKFADGFAMDQGQIGMILAAQGIYQMFATVFLFPLVVRRLGPLNLFRLLASTYFILYFLTPYLVLLTGESRMVGVYIAVFWRCTFSSMAYPSNAILLTNAAPSHQTLGTINGVAASTASLCRAFGPTISGFLYSMGMTAGYSGLAWWVNGLVAIGGAFVSFKITESGGRSFDEKIDEEDEEAAAAANDLQQPSAPEAAMAGRPSMDLS